MKIYLSLLLLASCAGAPQIATTTQCSPIFKYVQDVLGNEYIDVKDSYCICRKYEFTPQYVGPVGGSWAEDIKSCDRVVGWKAKEYPIVANFWVEVREYLEEIRKKYGY